MLTGLAIFLLVVIALLAIPVRLNYRLSWRRALQGSFKLYWLFGLVRIRLPLQPSTTVSSQTKQITGKHRKERSSGKKSNPIAVIRQKSFRQRMFKFIRDFWHAIRKDKLTLRIRIGLGDPADTGQLWAFVGPVAGMLASIQEASIEIEPEFIDAIFELESSGHIRMIPLQMLYLIVGLLLSPSIWQGIKQMRRSV